jgi:hypothetical protein
MKNLTLLFILISTSCYCQTGDTIVNKLTRSENYSSAILWASQVLDHPGFAIRLQDPARGVLIIQANLGIPIKSLDGSTLTTLTITSNDNVINAAFTDTYYNAQAKSYSYPVHYDSEVKDLPWKYFKSGFLRWKGK